MTAMFWHDKAWSQIGPRLESGRVPHAILLTGMSGIGKSGFAQTLAKAVLCTGRETNGYACGKCTSCRFHTAGSHPDAFICEPPEEKNTIGIDQVRALSDSLTLSPQVGSAKAAIVRPANALTLQAANALLKTLEEPTPGSVLMLVSDRTDELLPTILSRCQIIHISPPAAEDAASWLQSEGQVSVDVAMQALALAGGSPGAAKMFIENNWLGVLTATCQDLDQLSDGRANPLSIAKKWDDDMLVRRLEWFNQALVQTIRAHQQSSSHGDAQLKVLSQKLRQGLVLAKVFGMLDKLNAIRKLLATPVNRLSMTEELLLYWVNLTQRNA